MRKKVKDDTILTNCERLVMKTIWHTDKDLCLMELTEKVNDIYLKNWKPQTVSTFLGRLVKKNFVSMYRKGRQFYYHIEEKETDYKTALVKEFVDFWFDGDTKLLEAYYNA